MIWLGRVSVVARLEEQDLVLEFENLFLPFDEFEFLHGLLPGVAGNDVGLALQEWLLVSNDDVSTERRCLWSGRQCCALFVIEPGPCARV